MEEIFEFKSLTLSNWEVFRYFRIFWSFQLHITIQILKDTIFRYEWLFIDFMIKFTHFYTINGDKIKQNKKCQIPSIKQPFCHAFARFNFAIN